jgi:hypothetical protein
VISSLRMRFRSDWTYLSLRICHQFSLERFSGASDEPGETKLARRGSKRRSKTRRCVGRTWATQRLRYQMQHCPMDWRVHQLIREEKRHVLVSGGFTRKDRRRVLAKTERKRRNLKKMDFVRLRVGIWKFPDGNEVEMMIDVQN